jgi:hypothetical protein
MEKKMWKGYRNKLDKQDVAEASAALVVGIVLGTIATLAVSWHLVSPGSGGRGDTEQAHLSAQLPSNAPDAEQETQAQLQHCLEAAAATRLVLDRAASSIDQWGVHVGAMNQLVTGVITLQQATAFWNQTRVGAHRRVAGFERAATRLHQHGVDCLPVSQLPAKAPRQLRSCARQVAANLRVLEAAGTAIHTWRRHVMQMDMLRDGKMSPSTATAMWLAMWQRGQEEIATYRAAAHEARSVTGCDAAAPSSSF